MQDDLVCLAADDAGNASTLLKEVRNVAFAGYPVVQSAEDAAVVGGVREWSGGVSEGLVVFVGGLAVW